jgi:hypothetical protein
VRIQVLTEARRKTIDFCAVARVAWQMFTDVSEVFAAYITKAIDVMEAASTTTAVCLFPREF